MISLKLYIINDKFKIIHYKMINIKLYIIK